MHNATSFGLLFACSALLYGQGSLQITYPLPGTVIAPGETTQVNVFANAPMKAVTVIGTGPIGFVSAGLTTPPYQFSLTIPESTAPGRYGLSPEGVSASGNSVEKHPIEIDVELRDAPKKININHLLLEKKPGEQSSIQVEGEYLGGSRVDLSKSTRTSYVSQAPQIAVVNNEGLLTAVTPARRSS